jgi:hypothetical protein
MSRRSMSYLRLASLAVCLLVGCRQGTVPGNAEPIIERFLAAAAAGDTMTLRELTISHSLPSRFAALRTREPELLAALASGRQLQSSVVNADSVLVAYRFGLNGQSEIFTIGLVKQQGHWRVYSAGLPNRI